MSITFSALEEMFRNYVKGIVEKSIEEKTAEGVEVLDEHAVERIVDDFIANYDFSDTIEENIDLSSAIDDYFEKNVNLPDPDEIQSNFDDLESKVDDVESRLSQVENNSGEDVDDRLSVVESGAHTAAELFTLQSKLRLLDSILLTDGFSNVFHGGKACIGRGSKFADAMKDLANEIGFVVGNSTTDKVIDQMDLKRLEEASLASPRAVTDPTNFIRRNNATNPTTFDLRLDETIVKMLFDIVGAHICGHPDKSRRKYAQKLYDLLSTCGFGLPRESEDIELQTSGVPILQFKERDDV